MDQPFDLNAFLHCPQGPQMEGEARADAIRALRLAIPQMRVMTAASLLMQDPSLICEKLSANKTAVELTIDSGLDAFVLFALEHGMPVSDPAWGAPGGLLEDAVNRNLPGLVSCALLYRADPNLISKHQSRSLLDGAVSVACSTYTGSWDILNALQIARMLLDAGADPLLPCGDWTPILTLCSCKWPRNTGIGEVFTEALKRSGNVRDLQIAGLPIVEAAAIYENLSAVKLLIKAGAYTDTARLFQILQNKGLSAHIPAIKDLIQQRQSSESVISMDPAAPTQRTQINLAPEDFLAMQQGARLTGNARTTRCHLLDMAITQGSFVTVTKILSEDPSLITERINDDVRPDIFAVHRAIDMGMTALIPFALTQGMATAEPVFGDCRCLLQEGINQSSPALVSYALLNQADPNQTLVDSDSPKTFLDLVIDDENRGWEGNTKEGHGRRVLKMASMLLDAGANPGLPGAANTGIHQLCKDSWQTATELESLFVDILNRGGVSCANMRSDGTPILLIAANARNIQAVKILIEAGANTECEALGTDLFKFLNDKGMGAHIPALMELVMRQQIAQGTTAVLEPTVTVVAGSGEQDVAEPGARKLTAGHVF